ncbi:MAG: HDOD domain-containing protein [Bradymonadia bacterium]
MEMAVGRLQYRGVGVVVPEGQAIDTLLSRAVDDQLAKRLMSAFTGGGREAMRKLFASIYLAGLKEGVDRTLELDFGPSAGPDAALIEENSEAEPAALADLRRATNRGVRSPIQAVVDRYRNSELRLPSIPQTTITLNQLLSDPEHDVDRIIDLVRTDPMLSTRIMAIASSSFYTRGGRPPKHLHEAVVRIGYRELSKYLLAICNQRLFSFGAPDIQGELLDLWHHGLATALIAEHIAGELDEAHGPTYFLHGMLHDIGRALLVQMFDDMAREHPMGGQFSLEEIDKTISGLHGQFGSTLLSKWGFDESFSEVSMFHHQPQKSFNHVRLVSAISLADALAGYMGFGATPDEHDELCMETHPALEMLEIELHVLEAQEPVWRKELEAMLTQM